MELPERASLLVDVDQHRPRRDHIDGLAADRVEIVGRSAHKTATIDNSEFFGEASALVE